MRWYSIFLVAVIIGLSGCGGGSDESTPETSIEEQTQDNQDDTPTEVEDETPIQSESDQALLNLKSGWSQTIEFGADILYPKGIFKDGSNTIYTYSSTSNSATVAKLNGDDLIKVLSVDSETQGWGYQSVQNRFIYTTSSSALYSVKEGESTQLLQSYGVIGNQIAVGSDDSIYTCSGSNLFGIYKYDANGNNRQTIVSNVNICSSIVIGDVNNDLYYTSSYEGKIYKVDLSNNYQSVVGTGYGIPGTFEPITLGLDDNNDLFMFSGAEALYKYNKTTGTFAKQIDSISGAGNIVWSASHNSFLMGVGATANIIAYNTSTNTASELTTPYNANSIARDSEDNILICDDDMWIKKVTSSGFEDFITNLSAPCSALTTDNDDKVYVGLGDGKIISLDGTSQDIFSDSTQENIIDIKYDKNNDAMIVVYQTGDESVSIRRVTQNSSEVLHNFSNITVAPTLPSIALDSESNIYILERKENKIYKLDTNNILSTFATVVLDSDAITVPDMIYIPSENGLLISTIEDYILVPISNPLSKSTFGTNNGSVDNFAMHINSEGKITAIHSGQVFALEKESD